MTPHFFVRSTQDANDDPDTIGPMTGPEVMAQLQAGEIELDDELRLTEYDFWAPVVSWALFELDVLLPERQLPQRLEMPPQLAELHAHVRDALRWWLRDSGRTRGPFDGVALRELLEDHEDGTALVGLVGGDCWFPSAAFVAEGDVGWRSVAESQVPATCCPICLERVPADSRDCPECGEGMGPRSRYPVSSRAPSIPDDPPGASWLRMHWRPLVTMTAIGSLIGGGIALRHLAPDRYRPPERINPPAAAAPVCDSACWHGEACQMGRCVWQPPNNVDHIDREHLTIAGPFELPGDVVDVLPLDDKRYAVSHLLGVQINNARTGAAITLVSDAPHAQQLHRVGSTVYATAPKRIYVIDVKTTRVLKTIEVGSSVADLTDGANGRRVLASIPGARALAVIATDYHAEVARFYFGDDHVRPVAIDDTGELGLTTNGRVPLPGLKPPLEATHFGAMYAFDPSRLPSEQDKVRTGLVGNPVDVVTTPDSRSSYVVLREKDAIVRLERLASGGLRQGERMKCCRQPEEIALVRRGRRAIVRCNLGHAVEVFDLDSHELVRHIPLNARVADIAVTPDGRQAILALPRDGEGEGAVGLLDLDSYKLSLHELGGEPHRVRIAPDGRTATMISDRSKTMWVIR